MYFYFSWLINKISKIIISLLFFFGYFFKSMNYSHPYFLVFFENQHITSLPFVFDRYISLYQSRIRFSPIFVLRCPQHFHTRSRLLLPPLQKSNSFAYRLTPSLRAASRCSLACCSTTNHHWRQPVWVAANFWWRLLWRWFLEWCLSSYFGR